MSVVETKPKDADGNTLHEGDRVFGYDVTDSSVRPEALAVQGTASMPAAASRGGGIA